MAIVTPRDVAICLQRAVGRNDLRKTYAQRAKMSDR
jgi:hypothetical protein